MKLYMKAKSVMSMNGTRLNSPIKRQFISDLVQNIPGANYSYLSKLHLKERERKNVKNITENRSDSVNIRKHIRCKANAIRIQGVILY